MEYKDYYKVLGVPKTAADSEIKQAYRRLARQFHPDLNPENRSAEERFKEVNEAHEVLSDPEKRRKYDELGSHWEQIRRDRDTARQYARPGFEWSEGAFDFGDFFTTFFGDRMGGFEPGPFAAGPRRGGDAEAEITLALEDLYQGSRKRLKFSARREVEVRIPRGVKEGSKIRLAGMGDIGVGGGPAGDLYLRVKVLPHRLFHLEGYDLEADLPVWSDEAALGARMTVPTLDRPVLLKIPPGTQSGQRLRLKGKGLYKSRGEGRGDLYYALRVMVPTQIGNRERELFEELRRLRIERGEDERIRKHLS